MARRNIKMRPGKGQSAMGFFVGIIFCLIGLFIAVPSFGMFGILWTLVAVGITISHGMNVFSDKGIPTHEIVIEEEDEQEEKSCEDRIASGKSSSQERLEEAKRLYDLGLITEEEYGQKRKQILEDW